MAKILNVNDLLEAAEDMMMAGTLERAEFTPLESALVGAAQALAFKLATVAGVTVGDVSNQPGFAGLCATFYPGDDGKTCDIIGAGDEGGEW